MGFGYGFTRSPVEVADARAVIRFSLGPWAQMVAFKEADLLTTRDGARQLFDNADDLLDLVYGVPPIPVPRVPKTTFPPPGWFVAIALVRIAPGLQRAYSATLQDTSVAGAVRLVAPYSHVLLDITQESEDRLLEALDEVLDRPEVSKARVGIAVAEDVTYLDAQG